MFSSHQYKTWTILVKFGAVFWINLPLSNVGVRVSHLTWVMSLRYFVQLQRRLCWNSNAEKQQSRQIS